jgi:hypothetical protein
LSWTEEEKEGVLMAPAQFPTVDLPGHTLL